ncbi:MAG: hypothetical protein K6357_04745 [Elusimicrobiota bacterium]
MKNILKTFIVIILASSFLNAASDGTSGFAFLKIPAGSSRIMGLGNNGVSLANSVEAMNINPAGVAFAQMKEISFSLVNWFEDYKGKYISYVEPHGTNVFGVNIGYFSTDGFDIRDVDGVPLNAENVKFKNMFGSISFAKSFFMERFAIGFSAKYVSEDRYETKDNAIVYDAGAVLKISRKIALGFSQQNISGDQKKVVGLTRYGISITPSSYLTIVGDSKKYSDTKGKWGVGFEFSLPEELLQYGRFVFRAGYNDSIDYGKNYDDSMLDKLGLDQTSGWSFGIGVYSASSFGKTYAIEYSMMPYGELGKTSQITFKFQF